jgi:hypothetical protein
VNIVKTHIVKTHSFKYGRDGICVDCNRPEEDSAHHPAGAIVVDDEASPRVVLPDAELQRAVDALREVGAINATVTLTDGRVLVFRGGPFGTVEITTKGHTP